MADSNSSFMHNIYSTIANVTDANLVPTFDPVVQKVIDILLMIFMALVMMALGCTIQLEELKRQLRRPIGMGMAMFCQFIMFPALVFGLVHALKPDKLDGIGMILLGTCPGGAISNIVTFWAGGNVALSVSMTFVSTALGIGMTPLNLWIYTQNWTDQSTVVPYINIVITLFLVMVPVPMGMLILWKFPRAAVRVAKLGSVIGFFVIVGVMTLSCYQYPRMFHSGWQVWLVAGLLPSLGLCLGFLMSSVFRLTYDVRKAIAIEISTQNVALCLTLIVTSFPKDIFFQIMIFPLLFGLLSSATLFLFAALCQFVSYIIKINQKRKEKELIDPLYPL
ncbi:hypothetical protein CHS0354_004790 [Potamilus streckersoni]|uniref:Uncharacterized protein n=1 Tax=Potamilus streckersoni TaxID=2493646 RepID=A0AAE0WB55_9BIVA|nr:hypothetical protein CHS0354_004790 [Potamilus streckersoni]